MERETAKKGEGGGKGWGEYTYGGRGWKDRRVAVDRRHFPRRVVPVNKLLTTVVFGNGSVSSVGFGGQDQMCLLVVSARASGW